MSDDIFARRRAIVARAQELRAQGMSVGEAAEHLGMTKNKLSGMLFREGQTRHDRNPVKGAAPAAPKPPKPVAMVEPEPKAKFGPTEQQRKAVHTFWEARKRNWKPQPTRAESDAAVQAWLDKNKPTICPPACAAPVNNGEGLDRPTGLGLRPTAHSAEVKAFVEEVEQKRPEKRVRTWARPTEQSYQRVKAIQERLDRGMTLAEAGRDLGLTQRTWETLAHRYKLRANPDAISRARVAAQAASTASRMEACP